MLLTNTPQLLQYYIVSAIKALVEGFHLSGSGHGHNMDHWSSGDRS